MASVLSSVKTNHIYVYIYIYIFLQMRSNDTNLRRNFESKFQKEFSTKLNTL